jgi:deoxyribose-phosphate aldolase
MNLNKYIDHTLLKQTATIDDINKLCKEAIAHNFASVCVNPCFVKYASDLLKSSDIKVCTVVGFPLGANSTLSKMYEANLAITDGASEIDMVINISDAKMHNFKNIEDEIKKVKQVCKSIVLKVIIETCLLSDYEKKLVCQAIINAGADFVKTSTGFSSGGATVEDIRLLKTICDGKLKIKASGGIKNKSTAIEMITAGADRIGTSSGVEIVK